MVAENGHFEPAGAPEGVSAATTHPPGRAAAPAAQEQGAAVAAAGEPLCPRSGSVLPPSSVLPPPDRPGSVLSPQSSVLPPPDRALIAALANPTPDGEALLAATDPIALADFLDRPEIQRALSAAHAAQDLRLRAKAAQRVERAMDRLSAVLDACETLGSCHQTESRSPAVPARRGEAGPADPAPAADPGSAPPALAQRAGAPDSAESPPGCSPAPTSSPSPPGNGPREPHVFTDPRLLALALTETRRAASTLLRVSAQYLCWSDRAAGFATPFTRRGPWRAERDARGLPASPPWGSLGTGRNAATPQVRRPETDGAPSAASPSPQAGGDLRSRNGPAGLMAHGQWPAPPADPPILDTSTPESTVACALAAFRDLPTESPHAAHKLIDRAVAAPVNCDSARRDQFLYRLKQSRALQLREHAASVEPVRRDGPAATQRVIYSSHPGAPSPSAPPTSPAQVPSAANGLSPDSGQSADATTGSQPIASCIFHLTLENALPGERDPLPRWRIAAITPDDTS